MMIDGGGARCEVGKLGQGGQYCVPTVSYLHLTRERRPFPFHDTLLPLQSPSVAIGTPRDWQECEK